MKYMLMIVGSEGWRETTAAEQAASSSSIGRWRRAARTEQVPGRRPGWPATDSCDGAPSHERHALGHPGPFSDATMPSAGSTSWRPRRSTKPCSGRSAFRFGPAKIEVREMFGG